jgi:hypothetical protein
MVNIKQKKQYSAVNTASVTAEDRGGKSRVEPAVGTAIPIDEDDGKNDVDITDSSEVPLWTRGEEQPLAYRDSKFAIAFLLHLFLIILTAVALGPGAFNKMSDNWNKGFDFDDEDRRLMLTHTKLLNRVSKSVYDKKEDTEKKGEMSAGFAMEPEQPEDNKKTDYIKDEMSAGFAMEPEQAQTESSTVDDQMKDEESYIEEKQAEQADGSSWSPDDVFGIHPGFFPFILAMSIIFSLTLAVSSMYFLKSHGVSLIKASLIFNIVFFTLLALICIVQSDDSDDDDAMGFFGTAGFLINFILAIIFTCYALAVWHKIPFAASNLKSGVIATKANLGVSGFAFVSPFLLGLLVLTQIAAGFGLFNWMGLLDEDEYNQDNDDDDASWGANITIMGLTLSFYWISQVLNNISAVTVSGTVGTWWFTPHTANSCCSSAVTDSFKRAVTYSLGSICFGSLIVAILELINDMLRRIQRNQRCGLCFCIIQCLLSYIERLVEYFNKWAFIYVGLYGYDYIEAGKNVCNLFKARGWTTIISDNLVIRCLSMMAWSVGLLTAVLVTGLAYATGLGNGLVAYLTCWHVGFLVGWVNASVLMGVLAHAVDTIIVCFAEAPLEFDENHPELSSEMHTSWALAWPEVDTRGHMV